MESYLRAQPRSAGTLALVERLLRHFGTIPLRQIGQEAVDTARGAILRPGAPSSTVKRNLVVPLRAILLHASRRGWCDVPTLEIPPEPQGRTRFLLPAEFGRLEAEAPKRLRPLLRFLVCTGCRMGETLALEWPEVDLQGGRLRLWADQTKGRQERMVELVPAAVEALAGLPGPREGHVFRSRFKGLDGAPLPYRPSDAGGGGQIKHSFGAAAERAALGWCSPHHLRHSWASWHYAIHRDLLLLKRDGGWSSVELVERYAHLMPTGHEAGVRRVWGATAGAGLQKAG